MCVRFSYDDEMSDKARDFFRNRRSLDMDPGIPDCIDAALKDGTVRLPWKTVTEFVGNIDKFVKKENMNLNDKQKLEKAGLFEIIFESQRRNAHGDILMGSKADDLNRVRGCSTGLQRIRTQE